jgi:hypothetical protein
MAHLQKRLAEHPYHTCGPETANMAATPHVYDPAMARVSIILRAKSEHGLFSDPAFENLSVVWRNMHKRSSAIYTNKESA